MKHIEKIVASTIDYYDQNSDSLINDYDDADMSSFYIFLKKHLPPQSNVLDIGFGSGRDLFYLKERGFHVWGVEASEKFVSKAKKRFHDISERFITSSLPYLELSKTYQNFFDVIISVAVWMHLPKETHTASILSLRNLLKPKGKIILSYSITKRHEQEMRFFEQIDRKILKKDFNKLGFTLIDSTTNTDGLRNRNIIWVTEVYRYDQF